MQQPEDPLDITRFGGVVWCRRRLIGAVTVCAALVALGFSLVQTPTYSARATVVDERSAQASSAAQARDLILTDIRVIESSEVAAAAATKLDFAGGPAYVSKRVTARSETGSTSIITVTATDSDPVRASATANAVVDAFVAFQAAAAEKRINDRIASFEAQLAAAVAERDQRAAELAQGGSGQVEYDAAVARVAELEVSITKLKASLGQSGIDFRVIQHASPPTRPSSPRTGLNVLVATALGLLLGLALAFLRNHLDDAIRSAESLERATGSPPLGVITQRSKGGRRQRADDEVGVVGPQDPAADSYRRIRANLQARGVGETVRKVGVTAPLRGDGTAPPAANLAATFARAGLHVTVIDCDLHHPQLHMTFRTTNERGLSTCLANDERLDGYLVPVDVANSATQIRFLPAGPRPDDPSDLLASGRIGGLLADAAQESDVVLVVLPPALAVSDACSITPHLDGVLILSVRGETTLAELLDTRHSIEQAGGRVLGDILDGGVPRAGDPAYATDGTAPPGPPGPSRRERRAARRVSRGPRHAAPPDAPPGTPAAGDEPSRPRGTAATPREPVQGGAV